MSPCLVAPANSPGKITGKTQLDVQAWSRVTSLLAYLQATERVTFRGVGFQGGSEWDLFLASHASESSLVLTIDSRFHQVSESLSQYTLTEVATRALADGPKQFFDTCGDAFVGEVRRGGHYVAFYRLNTLNSRQEANLRAEAKLETDRAGRYEGELGAGLVATLVESKLSAQQALFGPKMALPRPEYAWEIIEFARTFTDVGNESSSFPVMFYQSRPWSAVPAVVEAAKEGHFELRMLRDQNETLDNLAHEKLRLTDIAGQIKAALDSPSDFEVFAPDVLQKRLADVKGQIESLDKFAKACLADGECKEPSKMAAPPNIPKRLGYRVFRGITDGKNRDLLAVAEAFRDGAATAVGFVPVSVADGVNVFVGSAACLPATGDENTAYSFQKKPCMTRYGQLLPARPVGRAYLAVWGGKDPENLGLLSVHLNSYPEIPSDVGSTAVAAGKWEVLGYLLCRDERGGAGLPCRK